MNGASPEPSVRTISIPNKRSKPTMGANHHFFRTFRNPRNSRVADNLLILLPPTSSRIRPVSAPELPSSQVTQCGRILCHYQRNTLHCRFSIVFHIAPDLPPSALYGSSSSLLNYPFPRQETACPITSPGRRSGSGQHRILGSGSP